MSEPSGRLRRASPYLLASLLTVTGSSHFVFPRVYASSVPPQLPWTYGLVYASGVAELVFATMAAEQGQAADSVPNSQAVAREEELRAIVREVTDVVGTPILQQTGASLDPVQMDNLVKSVIAAVTAEMAKW